MPNWTATCLSVLLLMSCFTATHALLDCYSCLAVLYHYSHCCFVLHAACGVDQWYLQAILASMTQTHGTSQVRQAVAGTWHFTGQAVSSTWHLAEAP